MKKEIKQKRKWYWKINYWVCALCGRIDKYKEQTYNPKEKGYHSEGYDTCGTCERREFFN